MEAVIVCLKAGMPSFAAGDRMRSRHSADIRSAALFTAACACPVGAWEDPESRLGCGMYRRGDVW